MADRKRQKKEGKRQKMAMMEECNAMLEHLHTQDEEVMCMFPETLDKKQRKELHNKIVKMGFAPKYLISDSSRVLSAHKEKSYLCLYEASIDALREITTLNTNVDSISTLRILPQKSNTYKFKPSVPPPSGLNQNHELPISSYREEILFKIEQNQVILITGITGSGKSTQVPQFILNKSSQLQTKCQIIMTQPRRIAATSVAKRISMERNEQHGTVVGHQIRLDSCVSPTSNLILTTSGYLLAQLTNQNTDALKNITHLIIDEVHERGKDSDFLLLAIKEELKTNQNMKIILMSATMDANKFSQYFDQCIVINIPGRTFEVEVFHLPQIIDKTSYDEPLSEENEIEYGLILHIISFIHKTTCKKEAILVFLPGYKEIMTQYDIIIDYYQTMHCNDYKLIMLHSNIEYGNAFARMPDGIRKIILATNIAETSITIDDVVHVIDAGILKEKSYMPDIGAQVLAPKKISKACAIQRTGRAGRTQPGFCYRLYTQEQYMAMAEHETPEIKRISLTEISLKAKVLAPNQSIVEFLQRLIDPPPLNNLQQSIKLLKDINALDLNENITILGHHLAHMPVDCQLGKMVLYAIFFKCLDPILTIVSAMSIQDPFLMVIDAEKRQKLKEIRQEFANNALGDHQMLLDIYQNWHESDNRRKFCAENYISNSNMEKIQGVRKILKSHVLQQIQSGFNNADQTQLNTNALKWDIIKACIAASLNPNFVRISDGMIVSKHCAVNPHMSSVFHERVMRDKLNASTCAVYGQISAISGRNLVSQITMIPSISVVLFANQINFIRTQIQCNEWLNFNFDAQYTEPLGQLRARFHELFNRWLGEWFVRTEDDEVILKTIERILLEEDGIEKRIRYTKNTINDF